MHDYAKEHDIPFKQHTFVWGSQQPGWIGGLSQTEQRAEVEEWIRLFCERYPDTQLIDVVNEPPPHTTPPYTAALGGAGASGYDWIVQAFEWARQYCPNAILILNDYNTIEYGNDNNHFIDIVNRIKAAGAPIDAIGAQAHAAYNMPTSTVKMYLDKHRVADRPAGLHQRIRHQRRRRQSAAPGDGEPVHDVLEPRERRRHHALGLRRRADLAREHRPHDERRHERPAMTWLMDFLDGDDPPQEKFLNKLSRTGQLQTGKSQRRG